MIDCWWMLPYLRMHTQMTYVVSDIATIVALAPQTAAAATLPGLGTVIRLTTSAQSPWAATGLNELAHHVAELLTAPTLWAFVALAPLVNQHGTEKVRFEVLLARTR